MHHCWINGEITKVNDARFHFYDLAFLRGYGLFDYFRTYNHRPFQWDWYWERYERSSKLLGIPNPVTKDEAFKIVNELLDMQGSGDCAFRFLLTGGFTEDSITMSKPNLIIMTEDINTNKPDEYINGISVKSYEYVRDLPQIKSIDYKHLLIIRPTLIKEGFADILLHHNGNVSELSRSNVFIIKGNKLITPDNDILKGITRKTVLELAKDDFEVLLEDVRLEELLAADEVFTTSSTKKILPVTRVDEKVIGNGKIGPKTQFLLDKINYMVENW